jgi:hypothetical protein
LLLVISYFIISYSSEVLGEYLYSPLKILCL